MSSDGSLTGITHLGLREDDFANRLLEIGAILLKLAFVENRTHRLDPFIIPLLKIVWPHQLLQDRIR